MFKLFLKGIVIGLANIVPGVSGGTLMVSMNVYDDIITAISHFFTRIKWALKLLIPIGIGMLAAIIASSFGLEYFFNNYPLPTYMLFIGLILGGIPAMFAHVKGKKISPIHIMCFAVFFLLVVGLAYIGGGEGANADTSFSLINVLKIFGVGIIASATMVIPGVSGSMMLLLLGYYHPIISSISGAVRGVMAGEATVWAPALLVIIPFVLGVVAGIVGVAKLVEYIFKHFAVCAYWAIMGLLIASPIVIVMMNFGSFMASLGLVNVICGLVTLFIGICISMKLGEK